MSKELKSVLNLTQHNKSEEQVEVFEPNSEDKESIKKLLLFTEMPDHSELLDRAEKIAKIASKYECEQAMIMGAPFFLGYLEDALKEENITPVYSFTQRISQEYVDENGKTIKQSVPKHEGFVKVSFKEEQNISKEYNHNTKNGYLNLTNHDATYEQTTNGVKEPADKQEIKDLITFVTIPSEDELRERASKVADIVQKEGYLKAMLGGAPYLDAFLRKALDDRGINSYYAFSKFDETKNPDGSVTRIFQHLGFVPSKNTSDYTEEKEKTK